jgi:hypothetical protein
MMESKSATTIGYTLDDCKYGGFVYNGEPFLIVSDKITNFKKTPAAIPKKNVFRDLVILIAIGYNLVFFGRAYDRFARCCMAVNIIFPPFLKMRGLNMDLYADIELYLCLGDFNYSGERFAIIPAHFLTEHPLFEYYRDMIEFIDKAKN